MAPFGNTSAPPVIEGAVKFRVFGTERSRMSTASEAGQTDYSCSALNVINGPLDLKTVRIPGAGMPPKACMNRSYRVDSRVIEKLNLNASSFSAKKTQATARCSIPSMTCVPKGYSIRLDTDVSNCSTLLVVSFENSSAYPLSWHDGSVHSLKITDQKGPDHPVSRMKSSIPIGN